MPLGRGGRYSTLDEELLTVKMIPRRGGLVASGTVAVSWNNGFQTERVEKLF